MVGERIRYYRKRQKMTLRELGEKSGFENRGDVRIAQYENGSRVPRTGTLNRIAKALGIPPEELFCEDCRKCMFLKNYYRKKRKSHTTFDMGIEEDNSYREHKNPEDEGILYDNFGVVLAVILDEGVRALINLGKYLRIVKKWGEWNG